MTMTIMNTKINYRLLYYKWKNIVKKKKVDLLEQALDKKVDLLEQAPDKKVKDKEEVKKDYLKNKYLYIL